MSGNPLDKFPSRLAEVRLARGLAQSRLAERTGVSTEFISRLERGKTLPSLPTLVRLCGALECTPNDLLHDARVRGRDPLESLRARLAGKNAKLVRDAVRAAEAIADFESRSANKRKRSGRD